MLKDFCECLIDTIPSESHIIASNEGAAVGLAIGHHLGSRDLPLVYLQNSGLGNLVNPILSLASPKVYGIPMLMLIGWRGEPGKLDEPQHVHQGEVTLPMLNAMNVPSTVLSNNEKEAFEQTLASISKAKDLSGPVALVIKKGTFKKYEKVVLDTKLPLTREDAIICCAKTIDPDSIVISTTGLASRELFEFRSRNKMGHHRDFLTVGGMGHANQIALGLAITNMDRRIYCFDGDGAVLMHMGSMATIGQSNCKNFVHILFNNGVHGSVGGQPTVGFDVNFCKIADGCGYHFVTRATNESALKDALNIAQTKDGPIFIEVQTSSRNRTDVGRPTSLPMANKLDLFKYLDDA